MPYKKAIPVEKKLSFIAGECAAVGFIRNCLQTFPIARDHSRKAGVIDSLTWNRW